MCSVFCILGIEAESDRLRSIAVECSSMMKHRGPDWAGVWNNDSAILAHQRLAIVDIENGAQPLRNADGTIVLCVNGEIYNHRALASTITEYDFQTRSDCEVILALYEKNGPDFIDQLQGMFAFVLYDSRLNQFIIGRDHLGIIPLYTGYDEFGNLFVASEMKALVRHCKSISEFPPGHIWISGTENQPTKYYHRDWFEFDAVNENEADLSTLRTTLESSVKSHLMSDVPFGVLLSGGLDSSLISAIAQTFARYRIEDDSRSSAWWPQIHSFAIGLRESPDLVKAKDVAEHIGTIHHSIHFDVQEGFDALRDVIYHIESYDVTTVRASTPMWLLARKIRAMGIKMVLSGEGSDELFGGYLYFHKAPNAREFHDETVRKISRLHLFDCLRANKSMAAWGVETRVPFLDKAFVDVAMRMNPESKMCSADKMEKWALRKAFDNGLIPDSVLWRQKEQFSDGVGYTWINALKQLADESITREQLESAHEQFPYNPPETSEAYLYRQIFDELFPHPDAAKCIPEGKSIACSTPVALAWDQAFARSADPSGRSVSVHQETHHND